MVYCIDSNIIVWGIKKQATRGQEEMIARAEKFFARADEYGDYIVVPTIVLAEILAPEPPTIRAKYLEIINSAFIVAPFDSRAALKYAEMLHGRVDEIKTIATNTDTTRQRMKADHMIIATAIVNNANCIYSTDKGLKAFSNGYIDVNELPIAKEPIVINKGQQTDMFKLHEDEQKQNEEDTPF